MTTRNSDTRNEETSFEMGMVENRVRFHQYNDRPISAARVEQMIQSLNEGGKIGREGEKKTCVNSAGGGKAKEEERSIGSKIGEDEGEGESMDKGKSDEGDV
jgi:hypothetical protein